MTVLDVMWYLTWSRRGQVAGLVDTADVMCGYCVANADVPAYSRLMTSAECIAACTDVKPGIVAIVPFECAGGCGRDLSRTCAQLRSVPL